MYQICPAYINIKFQGIKLSLTVLEFDKDEEILDCYSDSESDTVKSLVNDIILPDYDEEIFYLVTAEMEI